MVSGHTKKTPRSAAFHHSMRRTMIQLHLNHLLLKHLARQTICMVLGLAMAVSPIIASPAYAQTTDTPKKAVIIDRAYFFQKFRTQFHIIKEEQSYLIQRYETIFDYWDSKPHLKDLRWLAYILATTYHETGRRIQAVRECFGKTDQASINCVTSLYRKGRIKRNYAAVDPKTGRAYFGRGHVQLTWDYNYKKMGKELGMGDQIYVNPDHALHKDTSVAILAEGMIKGLFTGKRLSQYFNTSTTNWGGARRIVNGLDKYTLIGGYGRKFHAALRTKPSGEPVADACDAATVPASCLTTLRGELANLNGKYDDLNKIYQNTLKDSQQLQAKVIEQAKEIAELKSKGPDSSEELAALEKKYHALETRFAALETENNNTKAENVRLAALSDDLSKKLDDALTTGSTGSESDLFKERLAQLEARTKTLNQKIEDVSEQQQKLTALDQTLTKKQTSLETMAEDIALSREALQNRESNLLKEFNILDQREKTIEEEELKLINEEERLKRYETDLEKEKKALEEYYSKSWYTRVWDNVSSTWRKE